MTGTFHGALGTDGLMSSAARATWLARSTTFCGPRNMARALRTSSAGSLARSTRLSTSRVAASGGVCASHGSGSVSAVSGARSSSTVATSTPDTPSTMAWWVFWISAIRSSDTPSTNHSSHSGRRRSSIWAWTRSINSFTWASLPGAGMAVRRTW